MNICKLCNNTNNSKRMANRHLSYVPEITVLLCHKCHAGLHSLSILTDEKLTLAMQWLTEYRHLWEDAGVQYKKSKSYKDLMRPLQKQYRKNWWAKHPEKSKEYDRLRYKARRSDPNYLEYQREYQKKWGEKNREKCRENTRRYREAHKEEVRKRDKELHYNKRHNLISLPTV